MNDQTASARLVARCGLYCGACRSYLRRKCPGCHENVKATWCKVRTCCQENHYATCADCATHTDPKNCPGFHNFISRVIGFVLNSDRRACIVRVREIGCDAYAQEMAQKKARTLPRGSPRS